MLCEKCNCELGQPGKRRREEEGTSSTNYTADRLSHLPEPILYHVLSFLDTKSAVQTSVLSRAWRCAWKYVNVLNFRSDSFEQYSSFQMYLDKVLSLRYPVNVSKMSYTDSAEELDFSLFRKVIKYALSHDARHLLIDMDTSNADYEDSYSFSDMFGTISNCTLETLHIRCVCVDSGFVSSSFRMLTTLILDECQLIFDEGVDFFACCPSLKDMVLSYCIDNFLWGRKGLKISGPQLLSLKLDSPECSNIELFAPKLKRFSVHHGLYFKKFSKLTVPSLDHVEIWVDDWDGVKEDDNEWTAQCFISLFQDLLNVTSLKLDSYTIQVMSGVFEFLERQPSPFTRLKSLIFKADRVPYTLINYFLKGSSCMNPNVEFVRTS